MQYLLDVNVLLALAWPNHDHHKAAHSWFAECGQWASCPLTQTGFVRISCQPAVTRRMVHIHEAVQILASSTKNTNHHFWHQTTQLTSLPGELLQRVMGPQQLTDALLLDLAIRHKGVLATFDKRIEALLPAGSPHQSHLTIL